MCDGSGHLLSPFKYIDRGDFAWDRMAAVSGLAARARGLARCALGLHWPPGGAVATRPPARCPVRPGPASRASGQCPAAPAAAARLRLSAWAPRQPPTPAPAPSPRLHSPLRPNALPAVCSSAKWLRAHRPLPLSAKPPSHAFWFLVCFRKVTDPGTRCPQIQAPSFAPSEPATSPCFLQSSSLTLLPLSCSVQQKTLRLIPGVFSAG